MPTMDMQGRTMELLLDSYEKFFASKKLSHTCAPLRGAQVWAQRPNGAA